MSTNDLLGNEVGVQTPDYPELEGEREFAELDSELESDVFADDVVDEVLEREQALRPTVEMEVRAKVDTNHPDARRYGLTLEAEECVEAWEWEIERTRVRFDRRQDSDREERTRVVVEETNERRRRDVADRAASVDRWSGAEVDPREELEREELGRVNYEAARLATKLPGWSTAAISRRLAERVVEGKSLTGAVLGTYEEFQTDAGRVVPIAKIGEVRSREVTVKGRVKVLWKPTSAKIAQVGLIEDETGVTKFTAWTASDVPAVREGEEVVLREAAKSWYNGRVSVALTGWSSVEFPERERWWVE